MARYPAICTSQAPKGRPRACAMVRPANTVASTRPRVWGVDVATPIAPATGVTRPPPTAISARPTSSTSNVVATTPTTRPPRSPASRLREPCAARSGLSRRSAEATRLRRRPRREKRQVPPGARERRVRVSAKRALQSPRKHPAPVRNCLRRAPRVGRCDRDDERGAVAAFAAVRFDGMLHDCVRSAALIEGDRPSRLPRSTHARVVRPIPTAVQIGPQFTQGEPGFAAGKHVSVAACFVQLGDHFVA